ncbi:hypothetical protein DL96DRAFT_1679714 [Flagelloscypha sp. PMI_526]|nr:hypothetical protein DL96DRAFT_1679714 [Flagelloscypha sp. PMI_526]
MRRSAPCFCLFLFINLLATWIDVCMAKTVPLIQPVWITPVSKRKGFFFDYNNDTAVGPPVPVTAQCERIRIKWGRNGAQGSNPVAPFILQIYTSTDEVPFTVPAGNGPTFDFDVPFAPGTLYQICMYDSKGTPGGCQASYTMIANTTVATPTCQKLTAPPALAVEPTVQMGNGAFSRFGFIPSCTDLSVKPKAGKPPFVMTVSPSLHPPYNITSNSMDPITWTVSLSWSFQFFVSVVSADGLSWSAGPLHAGGFGDNDDCLAPNAIQWIHLLTEPSSKGKAQAVAAGAGVGSLFAGLLIGVFGILLLSWKKGHGYNPLRWKRHQFLPFDEEGKPGNSARSSTVPSPSATESANVQRAFVIHHDAGRAPVTVMANAPTEFVEMPPQYVDRGNANGRRIPDRSTSLNRMSSEGMDEASDTSSIQRPPTVFIPDQKDPNTTSYRSPVESLAYTDTPVAATSRSQTSF